MKWPDRYERYGRFVAQSTMTEDTIPILALVLAAVTAARRGLDADGERALRSNFVATVAAMDRSDLAYLRTVSETLPSDAAAETLATMVDFRAAMWRIRANARETIARAYTRSGRTYGWFDPIDPYTPPSTGLTHADETRIASIADGARGEAAELRARVNRTTIDRIASIHLEPLLDAKRLRRAAFAAAIEAALEPSCKELPALTELADGWY